MTGSEIIAKFETYTDDTTELSSDEELALLNKVYHKVCDDRPWEILKKEASGTLSSTTQITLPTDFAHFLDNYGSTDNSASIETNARPRVIWINDTPIQIVNWSDRKQYLNNARFAYVDIASMLVKFCGAQPGGATYSFDYKAVPADLTTTTSPIFPTRFHHILYHMMASEDMIIQLFDKARSREQENRALAAGYLADMALWNANLQND